MQAAWSKVRAGGQVTVMVTGEPGIGKTRLVREVARQAFVEGAVVLVGRCTEVALTPYQPFVEAIEHWVVSSADPDLDRFSSNPAQLSRLWPRLADRVPGGVQRVLGTEAERWQLFEAVGSLLAAIGQDWPVMLVLDDLHWADESTALLLGHLGRRAAQARLALVGTYRDSEFGPTHPLARSLADLRRHHLVERIALDGLDQAATAELFETVAGPVAAGALGRAVHGRTVGNPFFVEELGRHLVDIGVLSAEGLATVTTHGLGTPEGVRDVVAGRLRLLSEDANRVLAHAAVLGQQFDVGILERTIGMDGDRLVAALEEALGTQLLAANSDPFSLSFAFTHALVRDTVYFALSPPRRQELHRRAAEAIQSVAGTGPPAAELAYHWLAARHLPRALMASTQAAVAAEEAYAWAEALSHYEQAIKLWDRVPDAETLVGIDVSELHRRAAEAAHLAGASERAGALIEVAIEAIRPEADSVRLGRLYERLGRYRWMAGDTNASTKAHDKAVQLLSGQPPSVHLARVLAAQGHTLTLQDRHNQAEIRSRQAVDMARMVGAEIEAGYALCNLGTSLGFMGRIDEGLAYFEQARLIAERSGDGEELTRVYVCLAAVLLYEAGRLEDAIRAGLEGAAVARRFGVTRSTGAMATAYAASALLRLGRWSECDRLTSERSLFDAPPPIALPLYLVRAELELRRGRLDEARSLIEAADDLSAGMPDAKNRGYFHLRQAELAVWERRADDARAAVRKGLDLVAAADNQDRFGPELCALGVRAEADRIDALRGRDRLGEVSEARRVAADLVAEVRRITRLPLERATVPSPDAAAFAVVCEAEYSRLDANADSERWAAAVMCWEALGEPYPAAYARYRYAEASLASYRAVRPATKALDQALRVADALGATPLQTEIHRLAARAHLELGPPETPPTQNSIGTAPAKLGLTRRETEVLRLLATGQTNRQIASTLFISEKTASVHITNILRKLQVRSRVEAAAVGQRLIEDETRNV